MYPYICVPETNRMRGELADKVVANGEQ